MNELMIKINKLKGECNQLVNELGTCNNERLLRKSQELDLLICEYVKCQMKENITANGFY